MENKIGLDDLKSAVKETKTADAAAGSTTEAVAVNQIEAEKREQKLDAKGRAYATGKRKSSIARVWIKPGSGKILVNTREGNKYFARPVFQMLLQQPFETTERKNQYDIVCTVKGGGLSGQAGAVRHGISKALVAYEPDLHRSLKQGGFLTRDAREVERKKYGQPKARKRFQFSKR